MNSKRSIVLIVSLLLVICVVGLGFWHMTEPRVDAGSPEAEQCREYLEQLEMLNRYKLFWTFIQRRLAYSRCIERLGENHNLSKEDHPTSN